MRLIGVLQDEQAARRFSAFLKQKNINNEIELSKNSDWGSPDYATPICRVWVIEEDDLEAAGEWWAIYANDPEDVRFNELPPSPEHVTIKDSSMKPPPLSETQSQARRLIEKARAKAAPIKPMGPVTFYLLVVCGLLFLFGRLTTPTLAEQPPANIPITPLLTSSINKELMYDYPEAYTIIDKLNKAYGIQKLAKPQELPAAGKTLLQKAYRTPTWAGYYPIIVKYINDPETPIDNDTPMFEKIKEGEVWRLFTPCLLHSDIFHLFFNMVWLLVLGRLMEERLGALRFILFILIVGIFSNTAQYLMTGSNFIGFSGVLCGMIAFIWLRQKNAAWEGYSLQHSTITFIAFFILLMFLISLVSFILEIYYDTSVGPNIANTAHLAGALIGYILGRTELFKAKQL